MKEWKSTPESPAGYCFTLHCFRITPHCVWEFFRIVEPKYDMLACAGNNRKITGLYSDKFYGILTQVALLFVTRYMLFALLPI